MRPAASDLAIHVLRPPSEPDHLATYASILRDLRLQALREDQESFTEDYSEVSARPAQFWQDFIKDHNGLIHIAFGLEKSEMPTISATAPEALQIGLVMELGLPLSMAVNSGPVNQDRFLSLPNSRVPLNRPDCEELRFHGGMLFHISRVRGAQRGHLFEHLTLDRDEWLLQKLLEVGCDPPPVARFRGNIKSGARQNKLLSFYDRSGWYIAGTQTWRANLLAEGGESAVQKAQHRGDNMDDESIVVEKIFTVAHLEWQIEKNKSILGRLEARL